jgi:starch synthase
MDNMTPRIKVLYLAAEAEPFVKIGGLGDVAGSLPPALNALEGVDIRMAIPYYGVVRKRSFSAQKIAAYSVPHTQGPIQTDVYESDLAGVAVYLVSGTPIPDDEPVYSADAAMDGYKFTFFSLAALELTRHIGWQPDLIHANDWHTAPAIYALNRYDEGRLAEVRSVLGVHNLPYLGVGASPGLAGFGLPPAEGSPLPAWAQHLPLPLGLLSADHIVAVSPTYAREILTPEFGSGLEGFLKTRAESISGILNGIDTQMWNPATDPALVMNYSHKTLASRGENKQALQREFGLEPDTRIPLIAMVTRLDPQKGVDLVPDALRMVDKLPWQAIILGTGVSALEEAAIEMERNYPGRVKASIRFDVSLSRRIYAGADALLIPSRYEPCGLTQMIAMRYGCVPIARATGGLQDTIADHGRKPKSTGFLFHKPTPRALSMAIRRALQVFKEPPAWQELQRNGMAKDFSWNRSAKQYLDLYRSLLND